MSYVSLLKGGAPESYYKSDTKAIRSSCHLNAKCYG